MIRCASPKLGAFVARNGPPDHFAWPSAKPLLTPMATVARPKSGDFKDQDVIGLHEMVNGQLIFRVPYGAVIDDDERRLIQQNLNRAQRKFYRE